MVESSTTINKNSEIPIFLVVGDSGAGKSTFVNYLLGS
jgi:putative ribosome biogenesis GTPase RsgA